MASPGRLRRILRVVARLRTVEREVEDEVAFHLASREDELRRAGLSADEARQRALGEFGDVEAARAELLAIDRPVARRRDRTERLADLRSDLELAVRRLLRSPGYLAAALVTLALGLGANLGIAAVVEAALLHPLPYPRADRLVLLWETKGGDGSDRSEASYPDYEELRAGAGSVLVGLEGFDPGNRTATVGGQATRVRVTEVTPAFLDLLGARFELGRSFRADESLPGGAPVAVLSHRYWREAFGGDPSSVGRSVTLDGLSYTVVGVVGPEFHFALGGDPDLWIPLSATAARRAQRFNHWLRPVGRLREGVTVEVAETALRTIMNRLAAAYPETNAGRGLDLVPLRDAVIGKIRPIVVGLAAALAIVLLIVCANLASLTLTRGLARSRELMVRIALGAGRGRVARLLLAESLVVAAVGAVLGALAAGPAVRAVLAAVPEGTRNTLPFLAEARVSGGTLLYGALLGLAVGLGFGAAPLVTLRRLGPGALGAGGSRVVGGGRGRLRPALVVGQVALTTALLVGAGLLTRSLLTLLREDPGFTTDRILTATVALDPPRYRDEAARVGYLEAVLAEAGRLPGVRSVGAVSELPLNGGGTNTFQIVGAPDPDPAARPEAVMRGVLGDYFETLQIPLVAGRRITADDHRRRSRVVMVNRSLAERLWPAGHAVGSRLRFYAFPDSTWEVIGVAGDVKTEALDARVPSTIYYSAITGQDHRLSLTLATAGPPEELTSILQTILARLDPNVPGYSVATMREYVDRSPAVAARQLTLVVIATFAGLALLLALVGLYGTLAFGVAQRRRELGVRLALGATRGQVVRAVLVEGARLTVAGLGLGLALALVGGRALGGLLYSVRPDDPATYLGVAGLLGATGLAAGWIPARQAARVDPAQTLRNDG